MGKENPIYKFVKENGLTDKDEASITKEYSNPQKAEELHRFFVENKLTDKDSASFYDSYFKKKVSTPDYAKPSNVSVTTVAPIQSPSPKGKNLNEIPRFFTSEGMPNPVGDNTKIAIPQRFSETESEKKETARVQEQAKKNKEEAVLRS